VREVVYDAEHFFDGYNASPDFGLANAGKPAKNAAQISCASATPTAATYSTGIIES